MQSELLTSQSIMLLEFIHFVFYSDNVPDKSSFFLARFILCWLVNVHVQRIERNKNIWGDE